MAQQSRVIKTYMSFGRPVDPANVKTLVDLDLSYALASTLVDWTPSRNLKDGIAKLVEGTSDKEVVFKIRTEAKWSDGTAINSDQIIKSFNRAKKLYGDDLKSLFEILDTIEARDSSTIIFKLNRPVGKSLLLHKLTEPMYGVVFVRPDGSLNLAKTSGPFFLGHESKKELTLLINSHWYGTEKGMAEQIIIRQPSAQATGDHEGFGEDSWPNIVASSSLMSKELEKRYEQQHFSRWNRNLDRIFFLVPSKKLSNAEGRKLFLALNENLDRKVLTNSLTGFSLSQQFFPPGYVIFDPDFQKIKAENIMPTQFNKKPLELLAVSGRLDQVLRENLSKSIELQTGHRPKFIMVPLSEFDKARAAGNYDILVATIPVNDPNVEGAVSFFFGMNPPLIPNSGEGSGDFKTRTIAARNWEEPKRNAEYRKVFTQSVQDGCLLPLFHFSSIVVARNGIDLSRVPTSDETVAFSKVRFR
ncbi:MAG: ABC transporter substrate-binding protein [Pseudomonadota bacterium]|nr:ABC transporter substrate-binding protein [Pseudomonadota bacterium]